MSKPLAFQDPSIEVSRSQIDWMNWNRRFTEADSQDYLLQCQQFANGLGACDTVWTGYFYDGLWHLAAILHAYLVDQNHSVADLATESSRQALYDLSLQQDYLGVTGRVRQFNSIDPVTDPPSYGDRDGVNLLRQITGGTGHEFTDLAYRSGDGILWLADIRWSPDDSNKIVPCSTGSCDMSAAFLPSDRISQCAAQSQMAVLHARPVGMPLSVPQSVSHVGLALSPMRVVWQAAIPALQVASATCWGQMAATGVVRASSRTRQHPRLAACARQVHMAHRMASSFVLIALQGATLTLQALSMWRLVDAEVSCGRASVSNAKATPALKLVNA